MEGLLLILLPAGAVLLLVVAAAMIADVAFFGGDRRLEEREQRARKWLPPYIGGRALFDWSRTTSAEVVREALDPIPDEQALSEASRRVLEGATRAMLPDAAAADVARPQACPPGGQGTIGVTAPEAIVIAERIRLKLSEEEQASILQRATAIALGRPHGHGLANGDGTPTCALQGEDCVCVVFGVRPVQCRPLHAAMLLDRIDMSAGTIRVRADQLSHARQVAAGVEEGWVEGLSSLGMDDRVYELNSAIAAALKTPDVARAWVDGDPVFADCILAPTRSLEA